MFAALLTGLGLGLFVAAQVGPIWLLCARSSLRHGARSGLAIGAGAATIDFVYAALGVAGASQLVQIDAARLALGLVGAGFLLVLGGRTGWHAMRIRLGGEAEGEVLAPRAAFRTALVATASNPLTIASWAAVFAAASTAGAAADGGGTAVLLAGVGLGSLSWMVILASGVALARRALGPNALKAVDALSGAGLLGFGGLLAWRTLHD
jgi:putative LysE/RhtB family amino acid efflux pump